MPSITDGEVKLYLDRVKIKIKDATDEALAAWAFQLEGQTKVNIAGNDQVDTGFMMNSVYTITRKAGTYAAAKKTGRYKNKAGDMVERQLAPEQRLPGDAAAGVVVGANYAIYQEVRDSFLFKAAEKIARQAGGTLEAKFREALHD
jgi:hypothetical protein